MPFLITSFGTADELTKFVNGAAARGRIRVPNPLHLTDGQTITIDDGTNPATVLEIDLDGGGVVPGNIQVDTSAIGDEDKVALAVAIRDAINSVGAGLTVTATAGGDEIVLVADAADTTHNVALSQSAASTQFQLEGMDGGTDGVVQANIVQISAARGRWYLQYSV